MPRHRVQPWLLQYLYGILSFGLMPPTNVSSSQHIVALLENFGDSLGEILVLSLLILVVISVSTESTSTDSSVPTS
jgi:hypothetical protein